MNLPHVGPAAGYLVDGQCFTTRRTGAGVSLGPFGHFNLGAHVGDDPSAVADNRQLLSQALAGRPIQWLHQVHGTAVLAANRATVTSVPAADAAWTSDSSIVLAVLTADCLPIALVDVDQSCVAVAHAGWRGLVGGVIQALLADLPVARDRLRAWIGPAISMPAYEVSAVEVARVQQLLSAYRGADSFDYFMPGVRQDKYQLNLAAVAERVLNQEGVGEVVQSGICCASAPDFFSFRRDGTTGRMATVVALAGGSPFNNGNLER